MRNDKLFKPAYQKFECVRPINIYVLRVFFYIDVFYDGLYCLVKYSETQGRLANNAWCNMLCLGGLCYYFNIWTLQHIENVAYLLLMIFYKTLWLAVVAYPLWKTDKLIGSPSEELATIFIWAILPALFFPWKYFYNHFILPTKI